VVNGKGLVSQKSLSQQNQDNQKNHLKIKVQTIFVPFAVKNEIFYYFCNAVSFNY